MTTDTINLDLGNLEFIDNTALAGRRDRYLSVEVDVAKVMASWRLSLFAYEWLERDGRIKQPNALSTTEQPKRRAVEDALIRHAALQKPVLGIGVMDNIEIGSGRAVLLTLAALGAATMPVHIPVTHHNDFKKFLAS